MRTVEEQLDAEVERNTKLQQQYDELFEDYKDQQDELAILRCPPKEIEYIIDPAKIDIEKLKAGQQKYIIEVEPVNIDWWRAAKGETIHHSVYKVGEIVLVKGMKVKGPVTGILISIRKELTVVSYLVCDGVYDENMLIRDWEAIE